MDLVLMAAEDHPTLPMAEAILARMGCEKNVRRFESPADLELGLTSPFLRPVLALFLVSGPAQLAQLVPLRGHLQGVKLIVVLPEANPMMVSLGHALTPSLLTFQQADMAEIEAVAKRILNRSNTMPSRACPAH